MKKSQSQPKFQSNALPSTALRTAENTGPRNTMADTGKSTRSRAATREKGYTLPRNVNFYRHLINDHDATEHGLEWALKLRSPSCNLQKIEPTTPQPFDVGSKTIKCQEQGTKKVVDLNTKNNLYKINHLLVGRIGATPCHGDVHFETNLRSYGSSSDQLTTLEKKWSQIPFVDKKDAPQKMYPSLNETRRIKSWSTKNLNIKTHSAYDGYSNFPKYEEMGKAMPTKNIAEISHLFTNKGQNWPIISWQFSMRNYNKPVKATPLATDDEQPLGELKKVNRKPKRV